MALILLIVIGAIIGWLSSIIARADQRGNIAPRIVVSTAAAIITGALVNHGSLLMGLGGRTVFLALAAASVTMLLFEVIVRVQSEI